MRHAGQHQLEQPGREQRKCQPLVEAAVAHEPQEKPAVVVFLLLKQMQVGQQPARGKRDEADQHQRGGQLAGSGKAQARPCRQALIAAFGQLNWLLF